MWLINYIRNHETTLVCRIFYILNVLFITQMDGHRFKSGAEFIYRVSKYPSYKSIFKNECVKHKLTVINGSIDDIINSSSNSFFIIASQLNGAEYPSEHHVVEKIKDYNLDKTGGPTAQLAIDHEVGQYILDNASNIFNRNGINSIEDVIKDTNIKLINGYLKVPKNSQHSILKDIPKTKTIGVTGLNDRNGVIYGSAVPINAYCNKYKNDNLLEVANYIMISQYYGGLYNAFLNNCKNIYLMLLGGGVFNNKYEDIICNIYKALSCIKKKFPEFSKKVYVITYGKREYEIIKYIINN